MYASETVLWKKERSRVRTVQMDNLRGLLGLRRMDRVPNAWIRELCGVRKGQDKRIYEDVLHWFGNVERDRITKRIYVGVCASSCLVGGRQKRWIDSMKDCLKKRGLTSGKQGEWYRIGVNGKGL